jgi:hypothetical protein
MRQQIRTCLPPPEFATLIPAFISQEESHDQPDELALIFTMADYSLIILARRYGLGEEKAIPQLAFLPYRSSTYFKPDGALTALVISTPPVF